MPSPAVVIATGISQVSGRRSVSTPKTGWTTDDNRVAARVMPDTATYPSPRSATRNGTRAGTQPWYTSTHAWPIVIRPGGPVRPGLHPAPPETDPHVYVR